MRTALLRCVDPRRLATDIATAGGLGFVGDVICQSYERRSHHHQPDTGMDRRRLAALTAFNAVYIGGFLHFLYQCYPAVVTTTARLGTPSALATRLLDRSSPAHSLACACVDNIHCGLLYIPAFFLGVGCLQGGTLADAKTNLKAEWWPTYTSCTGFWIPYMWFNFACVPAAARVRAMAVGNLGWNAVIDYLAHRSHTHTSGAIGLKSCDVASA